MMSQSYLRGYYNRLVSARSRGCDIHVSINPPGILMISACDLRTRPSESYSASHTSSLLSRSNSHSPRTLHSGYYELLQLFTPARVLGDVILIHDSQSLPRIAVGELNLEDYYMDTRQEGWTADGIVHAKLSQPLVCSIHAPHPWWMSLGVASFQYYVTQSPLYTVFLFQTSLEVVKLYGDSRPSPFISIAQKAE